MSSFFIEFRDPLFSIILLFFIIFTISFFSYWWGKYKAKDEHKYLDRFLEQFNSLPSHKELQELIQKGELSSRSWLLLADAYTKNGDFEKAIEVYTELLKLDFKLENTKEVMFLLGKTYFKAGFLGRSRDVFLEILRKNPRTPQALHYLLLIYEYMREYNAALEVLEPLEELNEDVSKESLYLKLLAHLNANDIDEEIKKNEIVFLYREYKDLERMVFEYLFKVDSKLAWKELNLQKAPLIADILYKLDKEECDFEKINSNSFLRELFSAKGYINSAKESLIFELDILLKLPEKKGVTIGFEYICDNCKVVYPFSFNRCSSCHSIDTARLEYNLVKDYYKGLSEESNSFL